MSGQILHGNDPSRSALADRARSRDSDIGAPGPANGEPSQSSLTAAAARTAHLIVDGEPHIFADTLASALLGDRAEELIGFHRSHGGHMLPAGLRDAAGESYARQVMPVAAEHGEPWLSFLTPRRDDRPAGRARLQAGRAHQPA